MSGAPEGSPRFFEIFMASGYCGVTIFFVLSGFVLSINYFSEMKTLSLPATYDYFVARFARVYPLYLLVLLYVVVRQHSMGESIEGWLQHVVALQAWSPSMLEAFAFNGPAWSISV